MTHLRRVMLEEVQRRNYAKTTIEYYIRAVEQFAKHFHRPPDQLNHDHLREYQAYLLRERKLEPRTVKLHVSALRFFFVKTLKRTYLLDDIPYPKVPRRLPTIQTVEEVTGVTLTLAATPPEGRDPRLSETMREAILTAVTVPTFAKRPSGRADAAPAAERVAVHAISLRALLTEAPSVLSSAERQLLSDWLDRLAAARSPRAPMRRSPRAPRRAHSTRRAK